jgi:hypothetical protein
MNEETFKTIKDNLLDNLSPLSIPDYKESLERLAALIQEELAALE